MTTYCGTCVTCCQWNGQLDAQPSLEPEEVSFFKTNPDSPHQLATKKNGDCIYLDKGCTIYDRRPISCRAFDCRELLDEIMMDKNNVFMRTLMEAVRMRLEDNNDSRILLSTAVTTALKH